ncbi:tagaturonate epimerase family protein [Pelagicoccus sp. SDUM812002]|uniref:tagaturonate epimerase family protein n=1 Tax=Pelagicoccus sp. SDUM812002 TaxID=3041266 RepID=UPI00280C4487|nr:tagaturonate epimerase family protein [Pelagicoccus sp. SDUM812002]MDQ8185539.1 tagaturonate epimerase family protein [Pelagicoccus sp. SDUM812002]
MKPINEFLLRHDLSLKDNPCVSPDFCLDWEALSAAIAAGEPLTEHSRSHFRTSQGDWLLVESSTGDHAWKLTAQAVSDCALEPSLQYEGAFYYPASFENLIRIKNLAQEHDEYCAIFPTARGSISSSTLGIGARFTTLHWPGVDWAMANLGIGVTANQNSIPRELVFDVDAMLADTLDSVPFPFIGANVPEGHQGQSVEGMSHGCVMAKLKTGFHANGIHWSFNADHQPIGGKFDVREDRLVQGCLFASYITFDLSPELAITEVPESFEAKKAYVEENIEDVLVRTVAKRVADTGLSVEEHDLYSLLCYVWPSMLKMKVRDDKYAAARAAAFTTQVGREYLRELSIDELPGLTTPETTAVMLALCEAMDMPVNFVAPAFGFQKNMPYPDNAELRELIERQWQVCKEFGVSIGFHSGSGKSSKNYQVMGEVTGGNLEIKTSGRYTYEMGVALSSSSDEGDQALWRDWYQFTVDLAVSGAFSDSDSERSMAREFIEATLRFENLATNVFGSPEECRAALEGLKPNADHMHWFEYNFLYVLAANGSSEKSSLGDHSPAGYKQRARFYSISPEGRLAFARRVALYIIGLAKDTGLVEEEDYNEVNARLAAYTDFDSFVADIGEKLTLR